MARTKRKWLKWKVREKKHTWKAETKITGSCFSPKSQGLNLSSKVFKVKNTSENERRTNHWAKIVFGLNIGLSTISISSVKKRKRNHCLTPLVLQLYPFSHIDPQSKWLLTLVFRLWTREKLIKCKTKLFFGC